jgi:KAP family P-loop domain
VSSDEPRTAFLADSPAHLDASSDAFGHRDYAEAVAETLVAAPTPFTVGVFGPWGVGKSTIIGEVRRRLPDTVGFAYYDAWRYEGDALRRQLLRDVARQLHASKQLKGFDPDKDLEELEVTVQETREGIEFSWPGLLRSLIGAFLLASIVFVFLRDRQGVALFSGKEPLSDGAVGAIVFVASALLALLREPFQVTQRALGTQRLEEPDRFAAKFEQLMACVRSERVVIAIDNLDRCSPDRAVEILSTIKTYLEPAVEPDSTRRWLPPLRPDGKQPKPAVFLIAADIDALRRHLLSKELEGAGQPPAEAGRYVDEYLRKFFSATLPIRASLDTEMRTYVAAQLAELVQSAKLDESEHKKLIEMVAAALSRNPRRVKQFANNLEIRLQLLAARETEAPGHSAMIRPAISNRPLEVAKLALIEEEWPAYFKALFAQPRCLQQWELAARGVGQLGPGVAGPPPEQPLDIDGRSDDWLTLAAFLRASDGVSSENPRPFLRLKQSETEVRLPGFAEFTESIAAGEREGAMEILAQATEEQRRGLEGELSAVLSRELEESYIQGALQIVDLVVSQPLIAPQVCSEVLYKAVSDPRVKHELARLDPMLLLAAGKRLPRASDRELQTLIADRLISPDAGESEQQKIATALTELGRELSSDAREHIRRASDQATLQHRPDVVAIFAGFDDALVTEQTTQRQLQEFVGGQAQGSKPAHRESSMRIVLAGIRAHRDQHATSTIADYVAAALTEDFAQPGEIAAPELYAQALQAIAPVAPERVIAQSQAIIAALPEIEIPLRGPFFVILAAALESGASAQDEAAEFARQAIANLFGNPDAAADFIQTSGALLAPVYAPHVFEALRGVMLSGIPLATQCANLLAGYGTEEQVDGTVAESVEGAISHDQFVVARELVMARPGAFKERAPELVTRCLERLGQVGPGDRSLALKVAWELAVLAGEPQRRRVADALQAEVLQGDVEGSLLATALAQELAGSPEHGFDLTGTVVAAAERLISTPPGNVEDLRLLQFVCAHSDRMVGEVRERLHSHLREILEQRAGLVEAICETLTAIPESEPGERADFALTLLAASATGEVEQRVVELRTARAFATGMPAEIEVAQRIANMASSEDEADRQIHARLDA